MNQVKCGAKENGGYGDAHLGYKMIESPLSTYEIAALNYQCQMALASPRVVQKLKLRDIAFVFVMMVQHLGAADFWNIVDREHRHFAVVVTSSDGNTMLLLPGRTPRAPVRNVDKNIPFKGTNLPVESHNRTFWAKKASASD